MKLGIMGKVALVFFLMGALLVSCVAVAAYNLNKWQVEAQYRELALHSAQMAASLVNGDSVERYLREGADEEYAEALQSLQDLKANYNLQFLYVSVPDVAENNAVYVFDVYLERDDPDLIGQLGEKTGPTDVYGIVLDIYLHGASERQSAVTDGEFGYLSSAYAPLYRADGSISAVVGVDISMDVIIGQVRTATLQIALTAGAMIVLSLLALLVLVRRRVLRPLAGLSRHMEGFASEESGLREIPVAQTGDELQRIGESFNRMAGDLKQYIQNLAAVTADRERIAAELNVATTIQSGMLPSTFPPFPDRKEFQIYASMTPAKEVGGDFYDFFMLDGDRLCAVIADVSGKGVPAALFMVVTRTLIKNQAAATPDPGEILAAVNDQLCESNSADFFVTVFLCVLNLKTGEFRYGNAGHCRPLLRRAGGLYDWMDMDCGFVLAGFPGLNFETRSVFLAPGDRLFLYTDGVTEAQNREQALYDEDRLLAALNEEDGPRLPPAQTVARIQCSIDAFADGAEQADDITMLALEFDAFCETDF